MPRWRELLPAFASVERWLIPGECLICHGTTSTEPDDPLICATCRQRWSPLPFPQCPRCGQPLTPGIACRLCAAWPDGLSGVVSAVWLADGARRAVHLLKYDGWWRTAEAMARTMERHAPPPAGTTLIPIPLSASRQRRRGYNQSAVLANALGKRLGLRVAAGALARGRDTTTQTALTPEQRQANLAGAFHPSARPPRQPVLVDDVFTTGATLVAAASALMAAGAERISAVTFARAPRPLADAAATLAATSEPF